MTGIRTQLNRIAYIVVNVSDLERSRSFYEQYTPLRAYARTDAPEQPFRSLGIERGSFDGYLLCDATGLDPGASVHLVQWHHPRPAGPPYPTLNNLGYYRFAFSVPDPRARYDQLVGSGVRPFGPPKGHGAPAPGVPEGQSFAAPDPDGIAVQFLRRPAGTRPDTPEQLFHVALTTAWLDPARRFLQDVIGLDFQMRLTPPAPTRSPSTGGGVEVAQHDAAFLGARGDARFHIDLVQWLVPGVSGQPYESPANIGIQRVAFEVDDLDAAHASLGRALEPYPQAAISAPEAWDLGGARPRRVVVFRNPEGVPMELVEQSAFPLARETAWPAESFAP